MTDRNRFGGRKYGNRLWYGLAKLFLCLFLAATVSADDLSTDQFDEVERWLELERHERLLKVRDRPTSLINAFTTDGCSGGLSAGWVYLADRLDGFRIRHESLPPWESCCIAHDQMYHQAGSNISDAETSYAARKSADLALKSCVSQIGQIRVPQLSAEYGFSESKLQALYQVVAESMYRAVRIGGVPCSGLPWRWGYGWPECD